MQTIDPNPYEAPQTDESQPSSIPLEYLEAAALSVPVLTLASVSGIAGLVMGFVFWSQFLWEDEQLLGFLTPPGQLLTLLTGLGFALSGGGVSAACVWTIHRSITLCRLSGHQDRQHL
jgi:hypothetical protein